MNKHFILVLLTIIISSQLEAQNTTKLDTIKQLEEIIITYQADKLTPITFQNIYSKEIKSKSVGQEPSFLLSETPSITNYSDAGNSQGYSYFRLRGIDQTRINMTLDGVPLNEPEDQGAYFSNFPDLLNSISKIQIQRGVGVTQNGTASYGGSIQLFSPNLKDSTKTTFGLSYASFNSLRAFGEYNSGVKNNKAIYVRASQIYSDGYKYNSSNNSQSVFVSSGLFYDKSTWKINLLVGQQRNDMAWLGVSDTLINMDRRTNANSNQEKDIFFQSLAQIQNSWQISQSSFLQSSIYHTFLKGNYDFDFNNFIGLPSTEELYNYAFQSNLIGFFSNYRFSKKNINWTTGFHGNIYNRKHTGSEKEIGNLYQNTGFKNEVSFFTKANYSYKWITFFADFQYRYVNFDYEGSVSFQKLDWNFINPKAGLSASLNSHSTLYYSIGSTGREPTRNDMFGGEDDLLADSLGNPVLFNTKPEYVTNHELGFRYQKKKLNLNFNFYYMDFQNEIVLDGKFGPNGLALTNNVEQSLRTGAELTISYKVNNYFSFINNSSFNYSSIKEQSERFKPILTPPLIINQEAVFNKNNFTLALTAKYQHSSFIDFSNEEVVNDYFLVNCRASYDINKIQISIFMNNIINTKYFNQGYIDFDGSKKYFVQAPINFLTSIQYSF
ncbi:TonB-dependent receptor [Tenacibaculum sp. Bg11-29]|uniref:TonB-dependent receptor n=1 Tax=Tenacibaculum sp. Bg11-29 TaxID=2058306 RepID=UPI000C33AF5C|nr:TonB-dependent receptor [Tenacibaculum sp. Bg11-29]PKH51781.1 TonB-dependent receptor [Tenacibaculum sp. Bg11-29]